MVATPYSRIDLRCSANIEWCTLVFQHRRLEQREACRLLNVFRGAATQHLPSAGFSSTSLRSLPLFHPSYPRSSCHTYLHRPTKTTDAHVTLFLPLSTQRRCLSHLPTLCSNVFVLKPIDFDLVILELPDGTSLSRTASGKRFLVYESIVLQIDLQIGFLRGWGQHLSLLLFTTPAGVVQATKNRRFTSPTAKHFFRERLLVWPLEFSPTRILLLSSFTFVPPFPSVTHQSRTN